jgi:hypothetical protein
MGKSSTQVVVVLLQLLDSDGGGLVYFLVVSIGWYKVEEAGAIRTGWVWRWGVIIGGDKGRTVAFKGLDCDSINACTSNFRFLVAPLLKKESVCEIGQSEMMGKGGTYELSRCSFRIRILTPWSEKARERKVASTGPG